MNSLRVSDGVLLLSHSLDPHAHTHQNTLAHALWRLNLQGAASGPDGDTRETRLLQVLASLKRVAHWVCVLDSRVAGRMSGREWGEGRIGHVHHGRAIDVRGTTLWNHVRKVSAQDTDCHESAANSIHKRCTVSTLATISA